MRRHPDELKEGMCLNPEHFRTQWRTLSIDGNHGGTGCRVILCHGCHTRELRVGSRRIDPLLLLLWLIHVAPLYCTNRRGELDSFQPQRFHQFDQPM